MGQIQESTEIYKFEHKSKEVKGFVSISLRDIFKYCAQQKQPQSERMAHMNKLKTFKQLKQ